MAEMMGIVLDAVGFGIGLMLPFILDWMNEKRKQRRRMRREVA